MLIKNNKNLKKIIKILIIFLLFFAFCKNSFAVIEKNPENRGVQVEKEKQEEEGKIEVSLKINKKEFDIEENIIVDIVLISKNKQISGNIEIDGINKFDLISQSKTRKFSSDSTGNLFEKIGVKLILKARKSGEYYIGPLKINGKIKSQKQKIIISGEKLFIGNNNNDIFLKQKNNSSLNSLLKDKQKINSQEKKSEEKIKNIGKNEEKKSLKKIDISDMKTIFLNTKKIYPPFLNLVSFFIILLVIFLYFLYKLIDKYLILKTETKEIKRFKIPDKKINYIELIDDLKEKATDYSKEKFYNKLGDIFRQFLDEKNHIQLSSKSLKELEKILTTKYFLLYKKIYYPEYSPFSDKISERIKILDEFKNLINKK